jgi:uncharacterized protein YjiS (DUF1127 family)
MNTLVQARHTPSMLQRFVHGAVVALRSTAAAWQRARRRRAALRDLESLDDHLLRDIGLHREELSSQVSELFGDAPATRRRTMRP